MARRIINTVPVQVVPRNTNRHMLSVEFIASTVVAGNTGLIYGKFGSAPVPDINSNTWDFVLNAGAIDGANVGENVERAIQTQDLWLVADTAGQIVNVVETTLPEVPVTLPA